MDLKRRRGNRELKGASIDDAPGQQLRAEPIPNNFHVPFGGIPYFAQRVFECTGYVREKENGRTGTRAATRQGLAPTRQEITDQKPETPRAQVKPV